MHTNIKIAAVSVLALFVIVGVVSISKAEERIRSITLGGMLLDRDSFHLLDENLDRIKNNNFNSITLIVDWYIDNYKDPKILPRYPSEPFPETNWFKPTLTHTEIENIANKASKRGLDIILKMHIDTLDWPFGGKGRYAIEPNKVLWKYYTNFAKNTAIIAEKIDAKLLILGTETNKLDKDFGQWKKIVHLTKEIYRGPLTYSASFNGKAGFQAKYTKIKACGFCNVKIWPLFDYIGFEPYGGLTQKKDPTLEEMKTGFRRIMDEVAIPYAEKYNKKIIIPETSFFSFDGVNTNPISINTGKYKVDDMPPDHEEQALAYQAMLEVLNENHYKDFVEGIILWSGYLTESSEKNRNWVHNDKWDLIWGKKAEDTIKKVFANWN